MASQLSGEHELMHERTKRAAQFFDAESNYRGRALAVTRLRAELVREFLGRLEGKRILDLGSGDGQITAQFVRDNDVTWVDASSAMLDAAVQRLESGDRARVRVKNDDVLGFTTDAPYDVVMGLGLLAHVPDARAFILNLPSLVRPGGQVILQYSDHDSPFHLLDRNWLRLRERLRPRYGYLPNKTTASDVSAWTAEAGLRALRTFRFIMPPPVVRRFLPPAWAYRYGKASLALAPVNRFGAEVVALFERRVGDAVARDRRER